MASITGISSRATNGNVTNAVARTRPGVAKMIFRLCVVRPDLERAAGRRRARANTTAAAADDEPGRGPLPEPRAPADRAGRKQEVERRRRARHATQRHEVRHDRVAVAPQERAEVALQAEDQHEHQPRHHRRDRERQVDQRRQERAAREAEARDGPGRRDAEDDVRRRARSGTTVSVSRMECRVSGSANRLSQ